MDPSQLLSLNVANQALYNTLRYQVSTGSQGPPGSNGPTGYTGAAGQTGLPGIATSTGATGQAGSSTNTGATGQAGYTGQTGIPGYATNTGATGQNGNPGTAGAPGPTGSTGSNGAATNTGATGPQGPPGSSGGSNFGLIKVPSSTANFNFSTGVSSLPSSFATYNPGSSTDGMTFTLTLNSAYSPSNLPFFNVTSYVYSATAGYILCQRQMGAQSGVAAAYITINPSVTTITFNYINKTNFPYTVNDSNGYALYICFNIYN